MSEEENAMDYPQHEATYDIFIKLTKYGIVATVLILIAMALFLL